MSITYDWSPVLNAVQGLGQTYQYNKMLDSILGPQNKQPAPPPGPVNTTLNATPPQLPGGPAPSPISANLSIPNAIPASQIAQANPYGVSPQMRQMLQMVGPQAGMPLLLQMMTKQNEYDPTPRIGTNPNTGKLDQYLVSKDGTGVRWLNVPPREPMKVDESTGKAYNPNDLTEGQQVGSPQPKAPTMRKIRQGNLEIDQQFDPRTNTWLEVGRGPAWEPKEPKAPNPNAPIQLVHPSTGY